MGSPLHHPARIQHEYTIRASDRRQPMRDRNDRPPPSRRLQSALRHLLTLRIARHDAIPGLDPRKHPARRRLRRPSLRGAPCTGTSLPSRAALHSGASAVGLRISVAVLDRPDSSSTER